MHLIRNFWISRLQLRNVRTKETYAALQPYMEFSKIQDDRETLEYSIEKRGLKDKIKLSELCSTYKVYLKFKAQMEQIEQERTEVANRLRQLTAESNIKEEDIEKLKTQGKVLREELRMLRQEFEPIEDEFERAYLSVPNSLHPHCAIDGKEKLIFRNDMPPPAMNTQHNCQFRNHMERKDLIGFINNDRYYMFRDAAKFDVFATQALTRYIMEKGNFIQTANPDFVLRVLLEAHATPLQQYHHVVEQHLENQLNRAYLTGGASFESYLAAVTRLSVYPSALPLKYVSSGRIYEKIRNPTTTTSSNRVENLFTATQSNAVQTFVASETAQDADNHFEEILNLAVDFYKSIKVHFRIIYEDSSNLIASEKLRASIEVFSPNEQRYVCVGHLSNYSDFLSKRILFCMRKKKDYHFLHLVGGPILYTSRLIGALIENNISLDYENLKGLYKPNGKPSAIEEFKGLFK